MRYKLAFDTVFDTNTKMYSKVADGFDEDATGKFIIFNICMQGKAKACDFADANKFTENKSFDKLTAFFNAKNVPYVIDAETDFSDIKKVKVSAKMAERTNKALAKEEAKIKKEMTNSKKAVYDLEKAFIESDEEAMERQYRQNIDELRVVDTSNLMTETDILNDKEMNDIRDKHIMKAMKIVKDKFPLYYLMLSTLEKKYITDKDDPLCSTLAVTSACELLINIHFALSLSIPQLVFFLCHEAGHIALKHIPRCTAFGQNADINNIAGDLIINKMLADDLGAHPGEENSTVAFPNLGLYDPNLDLGTETLESLYAKVAGEMNRLSEFKMIHQMYEEILKRRFALATALAAKKAMGAPDKLIEVVEKQIEDVDNLLANIKF